MSPTTRHWLALLLAACVGLGIGLGLGSGNRGAHDASGGPRRPPTTLSWLWRRGVRPSPLWSVTLEGSVELAGNLSDDEGELARKTVVNMLAALYERNLLPFRTKVCTTLCNCGLGSPPPSVRSLGSPP
jgi:hypothetical protein